MKLLIHHRVFFFRSLWMKEDTWWPIAKTTLGISIKALTFRRPLSGSDVYLINHSLQNVRKSLPGTGVQLVSTLRDYTIKKAIGLSIAYLDVNMVSNQSITLINYFALSAFISEKAHNIGLSLGARRDYADPCYTIPVHVPVVNHPP